MGRPAKITGEAIDIAVLGLSRGLPKRAVKAILKEKFDLKARSCETVLSAARAEILEHAGQSTDEHRLAAFAFYQSVVSDESAPMILRLRAIDGIVKLLGLARPERIELSGPNGGPIQTEEKRVDLSKLTVEDLAVLREIVERAAEFEPTDKRQSLVQNRIEIAPSGR